MADLQTARLTLRPFTRAQVHAALAGRDTLAAHLGIYVPEEWPQPDFAGILSLVAEMLQAAPALEEWTRLIVHEADRTLIGTIGTHGPPDDGAVEIGYDIVPAYRQQGYASEAAQAFVAWLASRPGVTRIAAECEAGNPASIRILEKLGMRRLDSGGTLLHWEMDTH